MKYKTIATGKGLSIKYFLVEKTPKGAIYAQDFKLFSSSDLDYYRDVFDKKKNDGLIKNDQFEDKVWRIKQHNSIHEIVFADFPKDLSLALRCFAALRLKSVSAKCVVYNIRLLTEILYFLYPFHPEAYKEYEEAFQAKTIEVQKQVITSAKSFLKFYPLPNSHLLEHFFGKFNINIKAARVLPNYDSLLLFDLIINSFWEDPDCSIEDKSEFYPIVLWWKLTTTVPQRPGELLKLTLNSFGARNGYYWLRLPRNKQPTIRRDDLEIIDEVKIDKELYSLLCTCADLAKNIVGGDLAQKLINYEVYVRFSVVEANQISAWERKNNPEEYELQQFLHLLTKFYKKIVFERYNFVPVQKSNTCQSKGREIEIFNPMDTRHLAICNLMFQGVSPLTIAQLAGHRRLESQKTYESHMATYMQSKVACLTNQLEIFSSGVSPKIPQPEFRRLEGRSKLYPKTEFEKYPEVGYGRCTHPDQLTGKFDGDSCKGRHEFCRYYVLDVKKHKNAFDQLKALSKSLDTDIRDHLRMMIEARQLASIPNDKLASYVEYSTLLSTNAQILRRLTEQKAIIDYRLSYKEKTN